MPRVVIVERHTSQGWEKGRKCHFPFHGLVTNVGSAARGWNDNIKDMKPYAFWGVLLCCLVPRGVCCLLLLW